LNRASAGRAGRHPQPAISALNTIVFGQFTVTYVKAETQRKKNYRHLRLIHLGWLQNLERDIAIDAL
jgi:hypothetical protein